MKQKAPVDKQAKGYGNRNFNGLIKREPMRCNNNSENDKSNKYIEWNFHFLFIKSTTKVMMTDAKAFDTKLNLSF